MHLSAVAHNYGVAFLSAFLSTSLRPPEVFHPPQKAVATWPYTMGYYSGLPWFGRGHKEGKLGQGTREGTQPGSGTGGSPCLALSPPFRPLL